MKTRTRPSWTPLLLAVLLAACASPTIAPPTERPLAAGAPSPAAGCGPCCGRDPAAEARATQGISPTNPVNPYVGKDSYANIVVEEGTVLYSLTPGAPPGFAVLEQTLREAGGSQARYYELVQVTRNPGTDPDGRPRSLRDKVRAFEVVERLCAARGTARANPQFGSGGGTQYYVSPSDSPKLRPAGIAPISRWSTPGQ
jgi:hypothetical protein